MEPSRSPAQRNFKGERLYTVFIPPWRKQSKAVIFWCTIRIIFVHILNSVPIRKVIMWFTPCSFPSPPPPRSILSQISQTNGLSHKSTTANDHGVASQGRRAAAPEPRGLGWNLVRSYDFVSQGSLTHSPPSGLPWHWHTHQSSPAAGMPCQARACSPTAANTPRGRGELGGKAHIEGPLFPFLL